MSEELLKLLRDELNSVDLNKDPEFDTGYVAGLMFTIRILENKDSNE